MFDHLSNVLRHLLMAQIDEITDELQVRFQPPDEDWRTYVKNLQCSTPNVYLADLCENRKLYFLAFACNSKNYTVNEKFAPAGY
jgi:hypothetical protein